MAYKVIHACMHAGVYMIIFWLVSIDLHVVKYLIYFNFNLFYVSLIFTIIR